METPQQKMMSQCSFSTFLSIRITQLLSGIGRKSHSGRNHFLAESLYLCAPVPCGVLGSGVRRTWSEVMITIVATTIARVYIPIASDDKKLILIITTIWDHFKMSAPSKFGEQIPFCEPYWYQGYHSPYYTENHKKFRAICRNFVETRLKPNIDEWIETGILINISILHYYCINILYYIKRSFRLYS